jgi:hypothetical protein
MKYPLFLMYVDGEGKFYEKYRAGALLDSWFAKVEPGNLVLNEDLTVRNITKEESRELDEISDRVSESK